LANSSIFQKFTPGGKKMVSICVNIVYWRIKMKIKLSILALVATTLFMSCGIPFEAPLPAIEATITTPLADTDVEIVDSFALPSEAKQASVTIDSLVLNFSSVGDFSGTLSIYVSDQDLDGDVTQGDLLDTIVFTGANLDGSIASSALRDLLNAGADPVYIGFLADGDNTTGSSEIAITGTITGTAGLF
jgi:hypothetical protein